MRFRAFRSGEAPQAPRGLSCWLWRARLRRARGRITGARATATIAASAAVGGTRGPNGEPATPASALGLTRAGGRQGQRRPLRRGAGLARDSDFTAAVTAGVRDEFRPLGIAWSPRRAPTSIAAKQKSDIETVLARRPAVMLTLPVDPVITASAYQQAARQGTKIVLLSIVPQGMQQGRDYVNVVTDDLFEMGKRAADALAAAVGDEGKVGVLLPRRRLVRHQPARPGVPEDDHGELPADRRGRQAGHRRSDTAQDQASARRSQAPRPRRASTSRSRSRSGDGVLAALRADGNTTTKIVSLDLDEPLALDMAKGGQTFALIADSAYELGRAMATSAAYGLLGKHGAAVRDRPGDDDHAVEPRRGLPRVAAPRSAGERTRGARQVAACAPRSSSRLCSGCSRSSPWRCMTTASRARRTCSTSSGRRRR